MPGLSGEVVMEGKAFILLFFTFGHTRIPIYIESQNCHNFVNIAGLYCLSFVFMHMRI